MILSNIKEAREIILAKQSTDSLNKELEEYNNAIKKLKNIKASISNYTISMIKLNKINNKEFPFESLSRLIGSIERYETDASNGYLNVDKIYEIEKSVKKIEEELRDRWKEYYIKSTTPLINTVSCLKNISNDQSKVNIVMAALGRTKLYWPMNDRNENIINSNIEEGKNIISSLKVNAEIESFLKKIANNQATIFDLKPEILEWIKENNLEEKIILGFNN